MKPPRCRLCGKEHYGLCKGAPSSKGRTTGLGPVNAGSNPAGATKLDALGESPLNDLERGVEADQALTPAQKQKAYRKRGGAELREREKMRMRARRKSDG